MYTKRNTLGCAFVLVLAGRGVNSGVNMTVVSGTEFVPMHLFGNFVLRNKQRRLSKLVFI